MKVHYINNAQLVEEKLDLEQVWAQLQNRDTTAKDLDRLTAFCDKWNDVSTWPQQSLPHWVANFSHIFTGFLIKSKLPLQKPLPDSVWRFYWQLVNVCSPATNFKDLVITLIALLNTFDRTNMEAMKTLILASSNGYIFEQPKAITNKKGMIPNDKKWDLGASCSKRPEIRWAGDESQQMMPAANRLTAEWLSELLKQSTYLRSGDLSQISFDRLYTLLSTDPASLGLPATTQLPLEPYAMSNILTDLRQSLVPLLQSPLHFRRQQTPVPALLSQLPSLAKLQSALISQLYGVSLPSHLAQKPPNVRGLVAQTVVDRTVFGVLYVWHEDLQNNTELCEGLQWASSPETKKFLSFRLWAAAFPQVVDRLETFEQALRITLKTLAVVELLQDLEYIKMTLSGTLSMLHKFKSTALNNEISSDAFEMLLLCYSRGHSMLSAIIRREFSAESAATLQKKNSGLIALDEEPETPATRMKLYKAGLSVCFAILQELLKHQPDAVFSKLRETNGDFGNRQLQLFEQEWVIFLVSKCLNSPLFTRDTNAIVHELLEFGQSHYTGSLRVRFFLCLYDCWNPPAADFTHERDEELIELEALLLDDNDGGLQAQHKIAIWKAVKHSFEVSNPAEWGQNLDDMLVKLRYLMCQLGICIADACKKTVPQQKVEEIMTKIEAELQSHFNQAGLPSSFSAEYILQQFDGSSAGSLNRNSFKPYLEKFGSDVSLIKIIFEVQAFARVYHRDQLAMVCSKLLVLTMLYSIERAAQAAAQEANAQIAAENNNQQPMHSGRKLYADGIHRLAAVFGTNTKGLPILLSLVGEMCATMAVCQDSDLPGWLAVVNEVSSTHTSRFGGSAAGHDPFTVHFGVNSEYARHKLSLDILAASLSQPPTQQYGEPTSASFERELEAGILAAVKKTPGDFKNLLLYSRLLAMRTPNEPNPFARAFFVKELLASASCFRGTVFQGFEGILDRGRAAASAAHKPETCVFQAVQNILLGLKLLKINMFLQVRDAIKVGYQVSFELGMFRNCNKLANECLKFAEFVPNLEDLIQGLLMKAEIKTTWTPDSAVKKLLGNELGLPIEQWAEIQNLPEEVIKRHQMQIRNKYQSNSANSEGNLLLLIWLVSRELIGERGKDIFSRLAGHILIKDITTEERFRVGAGTNPASKTCFQVQGTHQLPVPSIDLLKLLGQEVFMFVETLLEAPNNRVRVLNYDNPESICRALERSFLDVCSPLHGYQFGKKCGLLKLVAGAMMNHFLTNTVSAPGLTKYLSPIAQSLFNICVHHGMFTLATSVFEFILELGHEVPADKLAVMALQISNTSYRFKKNNKIVGIELLKNAKAGKRKTLKRMTMRRADDLEEFYKYSWLLASREGCVSSHQYFGDPMLQEPKIPLLLMGSYKNMRRSMSNEDNTHIMFRSDGKNWVMSTLSTEYSKVYTRLIGLLVENEAMLKSMADNTVTASRWWALREQADKALDNQFSSLEESLGLDAILFSSEFEINLPPDAEVRNSNLKMRDHILKQNLEKMTTYSEMSQRAFQPRLSLLKANHMYPAHHQRQQQAGGPPIQSTSSKPLRTPRKPNTPIKTKNSAPLMLVNTWNQENMVSSYDQSSDAPPKPPKKPLFVMLDGVQHFVPYEHMPIVAEFATTQILRIAEVGRSAESRNQQNHNRGYIGNSNQPTSHCGPGFLSQMSSGFSETSFLERMQQPERPAFAPTAHSPITYYLINPKGDLKNTERQMKNFMGKFKNWVGKVGEEPTSREIVGYLQDHINFM